MPSQQQDVPVPQQAPPRPDEAVLYRVLLGLQELRKGNFRRRMMLSADGIPAQIAAEFNELAARNQHLMNELDRLTAAVAQGQWPIPPVQFDTEVEEAWRHAADSVNKTVRSFSGPIAEFNRVLLALVQGDLSVRVPVEAGSQLPGELADTGAAVNELLDKLSQFSQELPRIARQIGRDGKLGEQVSVPGLTGSWAEMAAAVNQMATDLTGQLRDILLAAKAVEEGDFTHKITVETSGEIQELKEAFNRVVDQLAAFTSEINRVTTSVAGEGRLGVRAELPELSGSWQELINSFNSMATNLAAQVRNISQVATAVARGDLTQKITVEAHGEILQLKNTINTMVDQLSAFADEVTRVAREVGTEGKLGGQARVHGVAGTWKDLTDSVNTMAANLTNQVRNIAQVTTAVARGDLSKKIDVDANGEILELKNTINTMVDQLSAFADEVTRVAREVGTEGKLGGQAEVADVSGTWRKLTESVNQLASNLTTQVRAIARVATAVTRGDLTQQITVEASGEVAELKDNINAMILTLAETTKANQEQDWLKTNLARMSALMQGQQDLNTLAQTIMNELVPLVSAQHGAFFLRRPHHDTATFDQIAGYACPVDPERPRSFRLGESLVGQAALDGKIIRVSQAPEDYLRISSGLGERGPADVVVLPISFEEEVLGVLELASLHEFTSVHLDLLTQLREAIGVNVNSIMVNSRTEELLTESQHLARELQARSEQLQQQQEELQRSNTELEEKAALLASRNRDIEMKNLEIEQARQELEERARQLSQASAYKSEFLANMSHELRTPLNSVLLLAKLLADNLEGNLTAQQVDLAKTIHEAGTDLLQLINDVLDLSKVEAGQMQVLMEDVELEDLAHHVEALYRPQADEKGLEFEVTVSPSVPPVIHTDPGRVEQILRNLLSNAIKFTEQGSVKLRIRLAQISEVERSDLRQAGQIVAFSVQDTGIGVPEDKRRLIFEAFQQVDGRTVRKYGGTGLGLSISRELTHLLGGELKLKSEPGRGSTFTLYLPASPTPATAQSATPARGLPEQRGYYPTDAETSFDVSAEGIDPPMQLSELDYSQRQEAPAEKPRSHQFNGEKVLIIDDDPRSVQALATGLEKHGLQVVRADNAVAGLTALRQHSDIVLVLMDVMMPDMDGNAAIQTIREIPRYRDLVIFAVTAKAMKGDREHSLAAGASEYVTKPVDIEKLLDLMAQHLPASTGQQETE
jgi:signal transduction histidine kinase/HAMP domain-containing protein/ActR/RegA family two-component response regulator